MLAANRISPASAIVSKITEVNCNQVRHSHNRCVDFGGVQKALSFGKKNDPLILPYVRLTTLQPNEIKEDEKGKHTKSKMPRFFQNHLENLTKFASTHYDGWSVSRVLSSLHLELPKNMQNVRDYLTSLQSKASSGSTLNAGHLGRLNFSKDLVKSVKFELSPKKEEEANVHLIESLEEPDPKELMAELAKSSASVLPEVLPKGDPQVSLEAKKNKTLKDQMVDSASEAFNSTVNAVWTLSNYFPFNQRSEKARAKTRVVTERNQSGILVMRVISEEPCWETIERKTRYLAYQLGVSQLETSRVQILAELSEHFVHFPRSRSVALEGKVVPHLLKMRDAKNPALRGEAYKALSLLGHVDPLKSKGVRILTIDGGGMRGLISLEILKELEKKTQKGVHELFDYICGVSTGSLLGVLTCIYKMSLSEAEEVYRKFSKKIFERNKVYGAGSLVLDNAFYDTKLWQNVLISRLGEKSFVDTMMDPTCPKLSVVSTLVNVSTVQNFLFRNYNIHPSKVSGYLGSVEHKIWEAIRASSAAPWYFEEFKLGDYIHQDGGLLTNNPTAIAIHESQLVWPREEITCVVSIGTGKYMGRPHEPKQMTRSSIVERVMKVIESATDTEGVHSILKDTLPSSTYFRFNPPTSETFSLDEIDERKLRQMRDDAIKYCQENQRELDRAAEQLLIPKSALNLTKDWLNDMVSRN